MFRFNPRCFGIRNRPTHCAAAAILLIENAFQYGVSIDEPSFVRVDLRVEDRKLHLTVENSITQHHSEKGAGTGLKNTEKRLALLYPDRIHYIVTDNKIPLKLI